MPLSLAGYGGGVGSLSIKINTKLILHLDADNSSSYSGSGTTWTDISGQGNNATLANGPTYNSDNGIGSIVFDGTNHYAVLDSSFQVSTSRTYSFEAWIYKTATGTNNAGMLISGGFGGDRDGIIIYSEDYVSTDIKIFSSNGDVNAVYYNGISQTLDGSGNGTNVDYNLNEWIHIAVTGITVNNTDGAAHHIAQNNNNSNKFGGRIRSLKVYDGELTASEVQQNFLKSRFIVTNNLIFNLDAGDSNSIARRLSGYWDDISGQGNNGTINGGVTYSSSDGGYFDFDGSNDTVTLPTLNIAGNELTFSVWNYGIEAKAASIIYLEDSSNYRMLNVHLPWSNGNVYFDKGGSGYDRIFKAASNSEYQGWHHWVFTANASTGSMKIYLDGSLWHSGTGHTKTFTNITGGTKIIGKSALNQWHRGYISNLQLYNKELSLSEVTQNYDVTKSRFGL